MIMEDISLSFQVPLTPLKVVDVRRLKFAALKLGRQEIQSQGFEMGMSQVKPNDNLCILKLLIACWKSLVFLGL